ncbi:hypothetical protein RHGRI_002378 [Rhododendron griersonianum]|uniref:Agglutinin domain-containing protein n=1 Tax=Rhododendron griersonianum TaxID=479676 RepID=A0AAV6LSI9_9ERIC|nr:hypothetical protein RHGRI_002378 [Rhododendron griersonianum]
MELPRFVRFKSLENNTYLRCTNERHGHLRFVKAEELSLDVKHKAVMAKCGGGLVHIRRKTGKYLRRYSGGSASLVVVADEPEQDQSKGKENEDIVKVCSVQISTQQKIFACDEDEPNLLTFNRKDAMSPYSKHEVVMAKRGDGLVHIRCCCIGKYWRRLSEDDHWIVAKADKAEEDLSKWSCTLFWP